MDEELWFTRKDINLIKKASLRLVLIPLALLLLVPTSAFAVEIENYYVENTAQDNSFGTTFVDAMDMKIDESNFALNGEYLIIATAEFGADGNADAWCNINATQCNSDWVNRLKVVTNNTMVSGSSDQTDFPIMVRIDGTDFTDNLDGVDDSLEDIRFLNQDSDTLLDYEIEKYDKTDNELIAWVEIPTLEYDADTIIYMYFDNAGSPTDEQDAEGVWDSNFKAVWHLDHTSGTALDSTSNNEDGTENISPDSNMDSTGVVDGADEFDGDDWIDIGDTTMIDGATEVTLEAWINVDAWGNDALIRKWAGGGQSYFLGLSGSDELQFVVRDGSNQLNTVTTNANLSTDTWYHVVVVWGGGNTRQFIIDGTTFPTMNDIQAGNPTSIADTSERLGIGARYNGGSVDTFFDGTLDELRVSDVARSDDWIETTYNNIDDPDNFLSISKDTTSLASTGLRIAHNGTAFEGSTSIYEARHPNGDWMYRWFTLWNNTSNESISMQMNCSATNDCNVDTMSLIAMRMDNGMFIKDEDYFFDDRTTDDTLSTTFTATNPSITIEDTDHLTGANFLILTTAQLDDNNAMAQHFTITNRTGEVVEDTNLISQQGENTSTNKMVHTQMRAISLGNADNTFTTSSRMETGSGTREYASVFAMNLDNFKVNNFTAPSDVTMTQKVSDWENDIAVLELDLSGESGSRDSYFLSSAIFDVDSNDVVVNTRVQVDDADAPTGQSDNLFQYMAHGVSDLLGWGSSAKVDSLSASNHTSEIHGDANNPSTEMNVRDIYQVGFTLRFNGTEVEPNDPMSWTDSIVATHDVGDPDFDDPISWTDDIRLDLSKNQTDPMSWTDTINTTIGNLESPDDPMSWTDFINAIIGNLESPDDPMSWTDSIVATYTANPTALDNYNEIDLDCEINMGTETGLVIEDGVDFNFQEDESYLIISSANIGGKDDQDLSTRLLHGTTQFDGSEQIQHILTGFNGAGGCGTQEEFQSYFYWTVWTPSNASEASEDISLEFESLDLDEMYYDHQSISVIHLDETKGLRENIDWFFAEDTSTSTLGTSWSTPNNAELTFTPDFADDDWLILGSNQLDTGSAIVNYESRLFVNGTETDEPVRSEEGGDPSTELFVQSFSRVLTLPHSEQDIQIQAQIDDTGSGTQERLHSSIFALNLDRFITHSFEWNGGSSGTDLTDDPLFGTEVATADLISTEPTEDIFILSDVGTRNLTPSEFDRVLLRTQVDGTDIYDDVTEGMTPSEHFFNPTRDADDVLGFTAHVIQQGLPTATYTTDIDASNTDENFEAQTIYESLVVFPMTVLPIPNASFPDDPMSWTDDIRIDVVRNEDDPMSWTDSVNATTGMTESFDDPMSWIDSVNSTFGQVESPDDPMSWTDTINTTIGNLESLDDPMSWIDSVNSTFGQVESLDDPMSWIDSVNATIGNLESLDDPMSWTDEIRLDLGKNQTDPMSWTDDIILGIVKNQTDPMSWTDSINATLGLVKNQTDPMSWTDEIRLDLGKNQTDPMSWIDSITTSVGTTSDEHNDPMSWRDSVSTKFVDNEEVEVEVPSGGGSPSSPTPITPDSDGDGFPNVDDVCPNVVGVAPDGCPLPIVEVPPEVDLPFELTQLDVIDDNIVLDTDTLQPQVEDLTIRWTGSQPITITDVQVGDSPFEIQIEDIPVIVGTTQYGITEYDILYSVQEPFELCTNNFSFDCLAPVTYDIPVVVTGEIDGRIVITEGKIRVDNSDRLNPYYLILFGIFVTLFLAILFFKRRRKYKPTVKRHVVGKEKTTIRIINQPNTSQKAGTTRSKLSMGTKLNVINPKNKTKTDDYRYKILSEKQRKEKKKKRSRLGF